MWIQVDVRGVGNVWFIVYSEWRPGREWNHKPEIQTC